jgi:hypothetical protein
MLTYTGLVFWVAFYNASFLFFKTGWLLAANFRTLVKVKMGETPADFKIWYSFLRVMYVFIAIGWMLQIILSFAPAETSFHIKYWLWNCWGIMTGIFCLVGGGIIVHTSSKLIRLVHELTTAPKGSAPPSAERLERLNEMKRLASIHKIYRFVVGFTMAPVVALQHWALLFPVTLTFHSYYMYVLGIASTTVSCFVMVLLKIPKH